MLPLFADEVLRGFGQVVFCNSSASGAMICGGLAYGSPWLASLALLGCASATAAGRLAGAEKELLSSGLLGYNGALVGCAFAVFLGMPAWNDAAMVGTAVCGASSAVLSHYWRLHLPGVPQWTLPFNLVTLSALALGCASSEAPTPSETASTPSTPSTPSLSLSPFDFFKAGLCGVSQIFVVGDPVTGAAILAAMACYSPGTALCTFLGSCLGAGIAVTSGASAAAVASGVWGYNSALTALMVSVFFVPGQSSALLAVAAAAGSTALAMAFGSLTTVPCLTLPFCALSAACHRLGRSPQLLMAAKPHSPEANLRAHR